ncbi:MAG: PilZ domain-containing protein [Sphingosinicella sp.]|uniref:PilZ domain-containing protein n=1 Tax=Sphingosinicella sp. TaxID=1917971 RepID=UPI0040384773
MRDADQPASPVTRQRRAQRKHMLVMVQLSGDFGETTAKILDVSDQGARLDCAVALTVGDALVLTRGELSLPSRVTWTRGTRVGLEFLEAIPTETLITASPAVGPPTQTQVVPEVFRITPMPALSRSEERKLARIWAPN